ncbi:tetratricopeptide repeat protein [Caproicibacter fermentans]|uniref:Tetratricopeptide repeat protein n=1 Tax=Caproicibacter fermentans TaxID=2576756 RepID=A0A7G8T881_9FIRM|nr:tetratricopeptide repeat protein [Caproicibacter fermentans]QNK39822.1 hypothetical protein HCR03_13995 [Caproicibacter fermentans]
MIFLKYSKFFLFIIPIAIAMPIAIVFAESNLPFWPVVFIIIVLVVLVYCSTNSLYMHKLKYAIDLQENACDPDLFLKEIDRLLDACNSRITRQTLLINKSAGILSLGDTQGALELLNSIDVDKYKAFPKHYKILYYNNLASAYLENNENQKAEAMLDKMKLMIENANISKDYKKLFYNIYQANIFEQKLLTDQTDECEEFFCKMIASSRTKRGLILGKFSLAKLYLKQGRTIEAKKLLTDVISNGNKLCEVEKAKGLLGSL